MTLAIPLLPHLRINGAEFCEHFESAVCRIQNGTGFLCCLPHHYPVSTSATAAADHKAPAQASDSAHIK